MFKYVSFQVCQTEVEISLDQQHIDTIENLVIAPDRTSQKLDNLTPAEHTSLRTLVGRLKSGCSRF